MPPIRFAQSAGRRGLFRKEVSLFLHRDAFQKYRGRGRSDCPESVSSHWNNESHGNHENHDVKL